MHRPFAAACAVLMTAVQYIVPGVPLYHAGWYNALMAGLAVIAAVPFRATLARAPFAAAGVLLAVMAGLISGLTGPPLNGGTETIIGAPGTTVQNPDFGNFVFPAEAPRHAHRQYRMNAIVWMQNRPVARISVSDAGGNALTITQPTNGTFLSPVLLFQQQAQIAGQSVPVDSFSVPAESKNVKAVLLLQRNAVVFDVQPAARNALGIVPSGSSATIGGLQFHAGIEQYPAYVAASAPNLVLTVAATLLLIGGAVRSSSRSKT